MRLPGQATRQSLIEIGNRKSMTSISFVLYPILLPFVMANEDFQLLAVHSETKKKIVAGSNSSQGGTL